MTRLSIKELVAGHRPGHALGQDFYRRDDVFEGEVERIFLKSWILAGHQSQVPEAGDFFVVEIAGESIIIVRSDAGRINALLNVCRHRGSRVCLEEQGHAARFVCPYHAWNYDLNGELQAAPQVMNVLDLGQYPLRRARLENFLGLLFINFDADAEFAPIAADLGKALAPYDLPHTKLAHRQSYRIQSNWKLAVENYCECYHCVPAHREFAVGHGRARPEGKVEELKQEVLSRAESCGLSAELSNRGWNKAEAVGMDRYVDRYPLLKGHVSGSRDGKPVAPLLGTVSAFDGGATEFQVGPISYGLVYCDYVVLYRFTPLAVSETSCEVIWLVRESAVEGKDFDLQELIWMWDVTTRADKRIIEDNRRGVDSRFFEPGPFTPMEYYTQAFTEWYLGIMNAHVEGL
jgi:Rieske 2Fe-2S family protein